jgi:hypothetical protein
MPPDERVRTYDRQQLPPGDELGQQNECDTRRIVRSLWSDLAFDVTGELLPQEQVLGRESRAGSEGQSKQPQQVNNQGKRHSEHVRESCRPEPIALVKPAAHANRISEQDRASATKS